ncbi:hypothetical protein F5X99DRAFT_390405 [Biscogniauxia marginata]|nr:hypothetical protein F5X99DRAFT_390405 [Biscogniauxia marginata]
MFGIWRHNSKDLKTRMSSRPVGVTTQACKNCRKKKIKCTGEKTGCSNCRTPGSCCYSNATRTRSSGHERNTEQLTDTREREANHIKKKSRNHLQHPGEALQQPSQEAGLAIRDMEQEKISDPVRTPLTGDNNANNEISVERPQAAATHDDTMIDGSGWFSDINADWDKGPVDTSLFTDASPSTPSFSTIPHSQGTRSLSLGLAQWFPLSPVDVDGTDVSQCYESSSNTSLFSFPQSHASTPVSSTGPDTTGAFSVDSAAKALDIYITSLPESGARSEVEPFEPHIDSQAAMPTANGTSRNGCQCLERVVYFIDELESRLSAAPSESPGTTDFALSTLKDALRCGESMLACFLCSWRMENLTMLGFLTDRLTILCERIVAAYLELRLDIARSGKERKECSKNITSIFFGDYEVDSPVEWAMLLRPLVIFQLNDLMSLVHNVELAKHSQQRKPVSSSQGKIKVLIEKMQI